MPHIKHRKPRNGDRVWGINSGRTGTVVTDTFGEKGGRKVMVQWDQAPVDCTNELFISVLVVLR